MTTPFFGLTEVAEGVVNQATAHNTALRQLEARAFRVLSRTITTPAVGAAESDSYIIPAGATGVWSGKTNQMASWIGGAWSYYTPIEGVGGIWVNDENTAYSFDGAAWVATGGTGVIQPFDVHAFYPGAPTASAKLLRVPVARAVGFVANFAGSYGKSSAAATASTAFDVQKNGVSIGTITFAAAATTATFASAAGAAQSLAAGDVLTIIAPATPDSTLADVGFVLAGTR